MNKNEVLDKAIKKATEGGWKATPMGSFSSIEGHVITSEPYAIWQYKGSPTFGYSVAGLIFNHDFARALWGNDALGQLVEKYGMSYFPEWQYHLQQMVIADDPIKYLSDNI